MRGYPSVTPCFEERIFRPERFSPPCSVSYLPPMPTPSIDGPAIVTPGGSKITGDYSRHAFSYVDPGGEPGAGATVSIQLLNEHLAHARQGSGPVEEWRRCARGVS